MEAGKILGRFDNPLPAPLDGVWGTFGVNVAAWVGVALLVALALNPGVKAVASRTKTQLDDDIVRIITRPTFALIVAFGLKQSIESFMLPDLVTRILQSAWLSLVVILVTWMAFRLWSSVILSVGKTVAEKSESKLDDRLYPLFEKLGGVVIVIAGLFYLVEALGFNTTFFAAGSGILALVFAFAAQETLGNFFSGVFLLLDRPFEEGDDIQLESGEVCRVDHIGLRSTRMYYKAQHEHYIMPNNQLANARIVNLLRPDHDYKVIINIGVAYGSDVQLVKETLLEVATEHPLTIKDNDERKPWVWFMDFGTNSLDFRLYCWVNDLYQRFQVASDLREAMDYKFRRRGIEVPFPQRVIHNAPTPEPMVRPTRDEKPVMTQHADEVNDRMEPSTRQVDSD